jgi:hypothetical protein
MRLAHDYTLHAFAEWLDPSIIYGKGSVAGGEPRRSVRVLSQLSGG